MKKYIDLTLPIVPHWRCMHEDEVKELCSTEKGDPASVTRFPMQTHWYTHIDASIHQFFPGKTMSDYPIDNSIGVATILDVSYVKDNQPITAEMLKEALGDDEATKIILIKTCWEDSRGVENAFDFWQSHDYWDEAPYMTQDAADFLHELNPNVIGFDFPQDYDIRKLRFGVDERNCYLTTHRHCLKYDIQMIEYMTNMRALPKTKYVDFIGLPIAYYKANGAQIRCVAVVDEEE